MEECAHTLQVWKEFDLDSKRKAWENQCMEIKEHKNSSIITRKHLNECTKVFRSEHVNNGGTVPLEAYMELLKSYQEEIDRLSKRAKYGEGCFVDLVRVISTTVDPVSSISTLMKMNTSDNTLIAEQTLELERLQNEVQEYDAEFATLKNQDIKIQRLEEQIADYKDSIEDQVIKLVEQRAGEIATEAETKSSELNTLMLHSERKYQNAVEALTSTQQRLEAVQSQCYEMSSAQEDKLSHVNAENASLTETLYRSNLRLAELESQLAGLHTHNKASSSSTTPVVSVAPSSKYDDSESLNSIITGLRAEMAAKEAAARNSRQAYEQRVAELGDSLTAEREKAGAVAGLQRDLEASQVIVSDYESLRKQYKVLQSIVFPTHAQSEEDGAAEGRSFDMMLSDRIKALDSELIAARNKLQAAEDKEAQSAAALAKQSADLVAKTELVQRLEAELDRAIGSETARAGGAPISAEAAQMQELSALFSSAPENEVSGKPKPGSPRKERSGGGVGADGDGDGAGTEDSSMVGVLQSQRNHFRDRLSDINKQYLVLQRQLEAVELSNKTLESENVSLYAKIKYLQSCSAPQAKAYPVPVDIEDGSDQKYERLYEQKLNPFVEFSNAERNRKLQELNIGERMLLSTTMACVSSSAGRSVLLVYVVTMHALVFFTLYYTAHRTVVCHH